MLVVLTLTAWQLPINQTTSWLAGLLTVVCAYQFHEWGHLFAAKGVRAKVQIATRLYTPFLFSFNAAANTSRQFLWMSAGGFIATAVFLVAFALGLPEGDSRTTIAMYGAWALAGFTVIVEGPIAVWVAAGRPIPQSIELF